MRSLPIETSDGCFQARFSGAGLARIFFPDSPPEDDPIQEKAEVTPRIEVWFDLTRRAIQDVLAGRAPEVLPPFDLSTGTSFQRQVWEAIRSIRPGQTLSYGEVARLIGAPKAVRAVGGACGANPIPLLIPCHRVLAKSQRIGGFSGGLHWKRFLLEREALSSFDFFAKNRSALRFERQETRV